MTTMSALGKAFRQAFSISAAVPTSSVRAPAGGMREVGPETRIVFAPRATASRASS